MDVRKFEHVLEQLMESKPSADGDAFRESLLERCLEVLDVDSGCLPVDESDLDHLSAAGDLSLSLQDMTQPQLR